MEIDLPCGLEFNQISLLVTFYNIVFFYHYLPERSPLATHLKEQSPLMNHLNKQKQGINAVTFLSLITKEHLINRD